MTTALLMLPRAEEVGAARRLLPEELDPKVRGALRKKQKGLRGSCRWFEATWPDLPSPPPFGANRESHYGAVRVVRLLSPSRSRIRP
jgi:hypothetical protein